MTEEEPKTMTVDDMAALICRVCIGVIVIATVLGKDIEDNTDKKPRHKPKGKWRYH